MSGSGLAGSSSTTIGGRRERADVDRVFGHYAVADVRTVICIEAHGARGCVGLAAEIAGPLRRLDFRMGVLIFPGRICGDATIDT
jgi:hypothetical protein